MVWNDKEFIADKIRYYRKKAKLTQAQLAEFVNISNKSMSKIEVAAYMPSLPTFLKIAGVLKMDLSEFGLNFNDENKLRGEFIKLIYKMDDKELECTYNIISCVMENLNHKSKKEK